VEDLALDWGHPILGQGRADSIRWREVLKAFTNMKTLHVHDSLIRPISGSLQLDDGESPMELLPELKEIYCSTHDNAGDAFAPFINARQNTGRPIVLCSIQPGQR